ncbi:MAG TPA: alkaline phosphatase family protein, partial [Bryobacteraceae bacterium]|nr:alkaline phosphatase family protein [Bryobacteraceae bacterium]
MRFAAVIPLVALAVVLSSQPVPREQPGPLPNGGFLLGSGWQLRPAGRQVPASTLPMSAAVSPDGKYLLVLNGGYLPPSISVIDTATEREVGRTPVPDAWLGLAFSPKGDRVYVGGGCQAAVFEFVFDGGKLAPSRVFPVAAPEKRTHRDFIGDVTLDPAGRLLYAADLFNNVIAVINPQSGKVIDRFRTGRRPYRILFPPGGQSFFVSSWADGTVYQHDTAKGTVIDRFRLGQHTTDMLWVPGKPAALPGEAEVEQAELPFDWVTARLFVTASNTNNVYVLGATESGEIRRVEVINVSMGAWQPAGMTPSALALSPDGKRLYIVCSDANAVAVADISGVRSVPLGFIPTGWYPTAVRVLSDNRIVVLNGRGLRSFPNPRGPNPTRPETEQAGESVQYVARMQTGTVSFIDPPSEEQLEKYSQTVFENTPYRDELLEDAGGGGNSPIPSRPGDPSPIKHVVYILKENRTYDQVFGDLKPGKGDPSLVLFNEAAAPNHRKLAREFVLLDNFYVNGDTNADGYNWSIAAIAPDYVQKLWPNTYGRRRNYHDFEGGDPAAMPPTGYLWTQAAAAGISMRNYGHFVVNRPLDKVQDGIHVEVVREPVLNRVTNLRFRGLDPDYPDVERAKVFLADLAEFEKTGQMPSLLLMRLGNDRTSGLAPGKVAPLSAFADNDAALGMIVEGISKSRFWPQTAIFVMEDNAQNGPDHVDSHRSVAFVISPYSRRGAVDSTMYNTTSMLRTIELILGLRPMTMFDAAARPMFNAMQNTPDTRPYTAEKPRIPLNERNPG